MIIHIRAQEVATPRKEVDDVEGHPLSASIVNTTRRQAQRRMICLRTPFQIQTARRNGRNTQLPKKSNDQGVRMVLLVHRVKRVGEEAREYEAHL
jgi:hypothetical protein